MRGAALLLVLLLPGCAALPPPDPLPELPPVAASGVGYSVQSNAIQGAALAFGDPRALAGRPAEAAVALARLEWLAVAAYRSLEFSEFSPLTAPSLAAARDEARAALGIARDAPPAAVIAALSAAAEALLAGRAGEAEAALAPPLFAPGMIERLSALPRLPGAAQATVRARRDLEFGREVWPELSRLRRRGGAFR